MNDDDLDRRAGKAPEDDHPDLDSPADSSDYGDPRVVRPGEDPPDEDAMEPIPRGD